MLLEYVASGTNYTRITTPSATQDKVNLNHINLCFELMQTDDMAFSLLYNAYQEKDFGEMFTKAYGDSIHTIHADSGGLQMVTQGVQQTPQIRADVYENQAKWADIAMSFDDIPVYTIGDRSKRLDIKNRLFDKNRFVACATNSGQNLLEQIRYFEKNNSIAKPLLIVQGNDLATYKQWVEVALSQIPENEQHLIGGVAMGGAALGTGFYQDVLKAYYYAYLPLPDFLRKHVHLLGVGAVSRLLPTIFAIQNGDIRPDVVSYDSSTHSSGPEMGRYYMDNTTITFGKTLDNRFESMYNDMVSNFKFYPYTLEETFAALTAGGYKTAEEKFGNPNIGIISFFTSFMSSVYNFQKHVDHLMLSQTVLLNSLKNKERTAFNALKGVDTEQDFERWCREVGQHQLTSQPVQVRPDNVIDQLFI
jgi:hypothetical protein